MVPYGATLFTIGTELLASRPNVTINERNLMSEKNIPKYEFGGPFKRVKTCPNGSKVIFFLIKTYVFGIIAPGAVHRSSALCSYTKYSLPMHTIQMAHERWSIYWSKKGDQWRAEGEHLSPNLGR